MQKVPMTAGGYTNLQTELKQLKTIDRHAVIKAIAEAREHGDLSENAEYHAARDKQSFIEGRILELEDKISRAEVIEFSSAQLLPSRMKGLTRKPPIRLSANTKPTCPPGVYR